jgi:hypothetical protein
MYSAALHVALHVWTTPTLIIALVIWSVSTSCAKTQPNRRSLVLLRSSCSSIYCHQGASLRSDSTQSSRTCPGVIRIIYSSSALQLITHYATLKAQSVFLLAGEPSTKNEYVETVVADPHAANLGEQTSLHRGLKARHNHDRNWWCNWYRFDHRNVRTPSTTIEERRLLKLNVVQRFSARPSWSRFHIYILLGRWFPGVLGHVRTWRNGCLVTTLFWFHRLCYQIL